MKKLSIYLYVILLFGCVESRNNSQLKTVNLSVKKAQGEQILKNLLLGNPLEITYTHEALIIWDESEAYYCKVICLDDEKMFSFGKKGKGPNEIIMLSNSIFDFSKSVYSLYSNNTGKILTFSVPDLKNEIIEPAYQNENLRYEHGYLSSILFTKNDTFLAKVCNLEKNNSYALLNENFKEIISGGEYPIGKGNNNYPKLSIGMMYQGKSVYNIDKNIG
ncbi:MAG TPA: BF3164 family lipoprotein, partial [Edaphocola sp.]|nr:BF3164 family lipoprotein [Edaphocola sp.]